MPQRLPDRDVTDVEFSTELSDRELLAGLKDPEEDRRLNFFRDPFDDAAG